MRSKVLFLMVFMSCLIMACGSDKTDSNNIELQDTEPVESITVSENITDDSEAVSDNSAVSDNEVKINMLSQEAYVPIHDEEGNMLETGDVVRDGKVDVGSIYEETGAVVVSVSWTWVGYDNQCQIIMEEAEYDRQDLVINGYGCGTAYYDADGNIIMMEFWEMHDDKIYDTALIFAKNDISIVVVPMDPNNDNPTGEAYIQIADSKGVRTLDREDIFSRSYTGIWYDAVCTIKDGVAEAYDNWPERIDVEW